MNEQLIVLLTILFTLIFFINGKIRYDFVALISLATLTFLKIIPYEEAFIGFSNSAVITVASVLVISFALVKTDAIEKIVVLLNKGSDKISFKIFKLMLITAFLSAFMNNIGALALILPVAIKVAKENNTTPSYFLMPTAFASLLGGMTTQIGTPPNLIVSAYRQQYSGQSFLFFDYSKVGVLVVVVGILFVSFIGYHLIPQRASTNDNDLFKTEDYLSEVVISKDSLMVNKKLKDFYLKFKLELDVLSIIRGSSKIIALNANQLLLEDDILIVRAKPNELNELVEKTKVILKGAKLDFFKSQSLLKSDNISLVEVVLRRDSFLINKTAIETRLRNEYNINLVAVSRAGVSKTQRLKDFRFKPGDILLLQIPTSILEQSYDKLRCLPLAERGLTLKLEKNQKEKYFTIITFVTAIILTSLNIIPVDLAFLTTAILLVVFKIVTPKEFYDAIEWPTILMLGALLPLGTALTSSGAADSVAYVLQIISTYISPQATIVVLMVITIILANLISTTATAVLMAPIALSLASYMNVSIDSLLIAVSIATSIAFITPISHQSNMLVMGPGGYKFSDYIKLGLPLSIVAIVTALPLILYFWPI